MKPKFVGLLVVAIMMAIGLFAEAKIIRVPEDYPTIQEGIDAAVTGDIVLVADGTYTGDGNKNLDFKGKAITVRSKNGPESTIIDCEGSGTGFYFYSRETVGAKVKGFTIKNCDVAAIVCGNGSSPIIQNNIITGNSSDSGGGIGCGGSSSPVIENNYITKNLAWRGGGIYCEDSSPIIQKNIITKNSAEYGGGIYCWHSSPNITNNVITKNASTYNGGAIYLTHSAPSIINSTIARNLAQYGGGVYCDGSSSPTVLNAILYFDSALVSGDEIYLDGGSITVTYSDIAGSWEGEGNIDKDPLFVGYNDYHLQPGSPCIDAGTPEGAPPDDLEGNPRDENPDMGAYEFQGGGDTGTINGTVTDEATGKAIPKAIVIAVNSETKGKFKTFTDGNGYYEIADLQPGIYFVICIKNGYNPGIAKVVVEAGKMTTKDFKLAPK